MPYNGSGVWGRLYNWVNDAANSIKITASRMDAEMNDMTTNGFGNVITRDGQGVATAIIPFPLGVKTDILSPYTASGPISVSAGQLQFPSSQNASANVNTLDDYKEGTWTPDLFGTGTHGTVTYSEQIGTYTKIGRLVSAHFSIITTNSVSFTGSVRIGGIPYNVANSGAVILAEWGGVMLSGGYSQFTCAVPASLTNQIQLLQNSVTGPNSADLTNTNVANAAILRGTAIYEAAT